MTADQVTEIYIDDVVRLLPKRPRDDVAAELRALLSDEAFVLSLVRGYDPPNEVAARYQPAWVFFDPADTKSFLRAAFIGCGLICSVR